MSAFGCVAELLSSFDVSSEPEQCVSSCMALHTLGCRIGVSVCATVEMVELSNRLSLASLEALLSQGGGRQHAAAAFGVRFSLFFPKMFL